MRVSRTLKHTKKMMTIKRRIKSNTNHLMCSLIPHHINASFFPDELALETSCQCAAQHGGVEVLAGEVDLKLWQ